MGRTLGAMMIVIGLIVIWTAVLGRIAPTVASLTAPKILEATTAGGS